MFALFAIFIAVLVANAQAIDFLLYGPSSSDSRYLSTIRGMKKTYTSVNAAQFASMSVAQLKSYRAIVFADPNCKSSTSYLPSTNLANLRRAVDGNIVVIGTDELYHWHEGGSTMSSSVLAYVASDPRTTGLYASFSCYYHGASPQAVPFLAPWTTSAAFQVAGAPGCFNNAHIVASSPALRGLTDRSVSNWSCSVHEVFRSFPPEFIPLAIARGISGTGSLKFADGSFGIPYILARGATLSPVNCGDKIVTTPQEECDGGTGCTPKCKCGDGYQKKSPPSGACTLINLCDRYGYSGKPANTASCTPGVNTRTITCQAGFYPVGMGMTTSSITLTGAAAFQGCASSNLCVVYGYSGKPANTVSCTPKTGSRTIVCEAGYHARGSTPATSNTVTLVGSATFLGCTLIDNCVAYGYSGRPSNTKSCINGINKRTVICNDGYYAVAPATTSVTLTGAAAFMGCTLIDNCAVYGYSGKPANAISCVNGVNQRTITCATNYYASASSSQGAAKALEQATKGIPFIVLTSSTPFEGCVEINECVVYGCPDRVSRVTATCSLSPPVTRICTCPANYYAVGNTQPKADISLSGAATFAGCTPIKACALYGTPANSVCADSSPNVRFITCNPGWYAVAPDTPTISVTGATPFAGCRDVPECKLYGSAPFPSNVISCKEPSINTRIVTCAIGYYAIAPSTPSVTLTGKAPFPGCKNINECTLFGYSGNSDHVQSCADGVNQRTITCLPGYFAIAPATTSITLVGSATFSGCTVIDECKLYGFSGKEENTVSCTNSAPNVRTILCKPGYAALPPSSDSVTLVASAPFNGCTDIDECAVYGYSGKPANAVCQNSGINQRTITCAKGFYPSGVEGLISSITLTGSSPFGGCVELNQCTQYGYSGNGKYAKSCVTSPGSRVITCLPGYWVTGTKAASITLGDGATFVGCTEIDECKEYGYSSKTSNTLSCTDGVNSRVITCKPGYYAVAPATASVTLVAKDAFGGCFDINECTAFGYSGKDSNTLSCVEGLNQRTITCKTGFFAVAPDSPVITIAGSGTFAGCTDIDECSIYRYSGKTDNTISCTNSAVNQRTIVCATGYYAVAPTTGTITLTGKAPFAGCSQIDMCATNANGGNIASCKNGVNQRTLTCVTGYYAVPPSTGSITIQGSVAFGGCKDISECAVSRCDDIKSRQTTSCVDSFPATPIGTRICTCPVGWFAIENSPSRSVTLTATAVFDGCDELCGDSLKVGTEACDDGNLVDGDGCSKTCVLERGFVCPFPGKACETVCGDGSKNGKEACDDGNKVNGDGCSKTCDIEAGWSCPTPGSPCEVLQLCLLLGYDGKSDNTKSCVDSLNARTITCASGYYAIAPSNPTIKIIGYDKFTGCTLIDNCAVYGYSGKPANTASCKNGVNQRTIVCQDGYYAIAPSVGTITLVGSDSFTGCSQIDECGLYGYSGRSSNTLSCKDGLLERTITCQPGFYAVAPTTPSVTLKGKEEFKGCFDINECTAYGDSGKPSNIKSCQNLVNSRKITCNDGFYAVAPTTASITLTGAAAFTGCIDIDECAAYGFSGKTEFTADCLTPAVNSRVIKCKPGYYPSGATMNQESITLHGNTAFGGCSLANQCTIYGYSGKPDNAVSCEPGVNVRTITCALGYTATPGTGIKVTLTGGAVFGGCVDIDECKLYSYSGKESNTASCSNEVNERTITCKAGYSAVDPDVQSVTLVADAPFEGCKEIDECKIYGTSGRPSFVESCKGAINTRTITCIAGYWATAPDIRSITLTGSASFAGCTLIDTCGVYGFNGFPERTLSCVSGVNKRTITCEPGFMAQRPSDPVIVLVGNANFTGCKEINMCNIYGFGDHASCDSGPNMRTINCDPGWFITPPTDDIIVIEGPKEFSGCKDLNECEVYGCDDEPLVTSCADSTSNKTISENTRVCTCPKGYSPKGLSELVDGGSITVIGSTPFDGCIETCGDSKILKPETCDDGNVKAGDGCTEKCQIEPGWDCPKPGVPCKNIDECALYKGQDSSARFFKDCRDGVNNRTITCQPGYYAVAPDTPSITLVGAAEFKGCFLIKGCAIYGANGQANVKDCTDAINTRTVTCQDGFNVVGQNPPTQSMLLVGNAKFPGCVIADMCQLYLAKYSLPNGVCANIGINEYEITCNQGWYARPPSVRQIELAGRSPTWDGCKEIDECELYGFSKNAVNTLSCTDGPNSRTITCQPGFYAAKPDKRSITLTGSALFSGCFDISECNIYGSSGQPNVASCDEFSPNSRTLTCEIGYIPKGQRRNTVTLSGSTAFEGCIEVPPRCGNGYIDPSLNEECDDGNDKSGDGCSNSCQVERGWTCDEPDTPCCRIIDHLITVPVVCQRGWWTPRNDPGGLISMRAKDGSQVILDGVRMCGNVVFDKEHEDVSESILIVDGVRWIIDGSLELYGSVLEFRNGGNIQLQNSDGACSSFIRKRQDEAYQFWMSSNSTIEYSEVEWNDEETTPTPAINATDCVHVDGKFMFRAPSIPNGSNKFTAISANCVDGEMEMQHDIPGTCSDALIGDEVSDEEKKSKSDKNAMEITVHRKHLCTASIITASLLIGIVGVIAILFAAYFFMNGSVSQDTDGYYNL